MPESVERTTKRPRAYVKDVTRRMLTHNFKSRYYIFTKASIAATILTDSEKFAKFLTVKKER